MYQQQLTFFFQFQLIYCLYPMTTLSLSSDPNLFDYRRFDYYYLFIVSLIVIFGILITKMVIKTTIQIKVTV